MKIQIKNVGTYKMDSIEKLTLKELILLEHQSDLLGRRLTIGTVKTMSAALDACATDEERENHPDAGMFFGVAVWIARRRSGEDITLGDAIDFDLEDLTMIREPGDPEPGKKKGPTSARPGSGPGARSVPADRARKSTSKPKSSDTSS